MKKIFLLVLMIFSCLGYAEKSIFLKKGMKVFVQDPNIMGLYLPGTINSIDEKNYRVQIYLENGDKIEEDGNNLIIPNRKLSQLKKVEKFQPVIFLDETTSGNKPEWVKGRVQSINRQKGIEILSQSDISREKEKKIYSLDEVYALDTINSLNVPECKRENFLYEKWYKKKNMPQYDQGPTGVTGICYTYAGLQMVDMWREMNGLKVTNKILLGDNIYAGLLGRRYVAEEINKPTANTLVTLQGGSTSYVVEGIRKWGMCKPEVISASLANFSKQNGFVNTQEFYIVSLFLSTTWESERENSPNNFLSALDKDLYIAENIMKTFRTTDKGTFVQKFKTDANLKKIMEALKPYIKKQNYIGFLKDVFSNCERPENKILIRPPMPKLNSIKPLKFEGTDKQNKYLYDNLNKLLSRKVKSPVGINLCGKFLKNRDLEGLELPNRSQIKESCGGHAMVVIGRRARAGKCQFLLKNSHGNDCNYAFECERNPEGEEEGLWLDTEPLFNNSYGLQFFEY